MSNQDYINKLSEISHFKLHPELIPYVGPYYDTLKIVLIGESHFIKNDYDANNSTDHLPENWYSKNISDLNYINKYCEGWFTTHKVINNYLYTENGKHPKRTRSHRIFSNTSKVISENLKSKHNIEISNDDSLRTCSFFNYFQRPSITQNGTIKETEVDIEKSYKIYNEIIDILNPNLIVVLSKKAYDKGPCQSLDIRLNYTYHPNSSYWYSSELGKVKFNMLLDKYLGDSRIDISSIK